jgi:hypothetical protein
MKSTFYESQHRRMLFRTPWTRSHLNRAGPRVEEGRPRHVGTLIPRVAVVGAAVAITTAIAATAPVTTTVVVVVVVAGLLRRTLLLLLLSGGRGGPPEEVGTDGGLGSM